MSRPITIMAHPYDVTIVLHTSPEAAAKSAYRQKENREEFLDTFGENCGCCMESGSWVHVCVFKGGLPVLVHELTHACLYILKRAGIDPTSNSGEPLCYLLDNLFGRLQKHIKEDA